MVGDLFVCVAALAVDEEVGDVQSAEERHEDGAWCELVSDCFEEVCGLRGFVVEPVLGFVECDGLARLVWWELP